MFFEMLAWWYGRGWSLAWRQSLGWVKNVQRTFSADVLLRTLFSPWKRIISTPGRSLDEKFRAAIDNLFSRVVGFFVRLATLVFALIVLVAAALAGLVLALVWPLMPLAVIWLIYLGVVG